MFIILLDADTVFDTMKEAGDRFDSDSDSPLAEVAPAKKTARRYTRKHDNCHRRTAPYLLSDGTSSDDK